MLCFTNDWQCFQFSSSMIRQQKLTDLPFEVMMVKFSPLISVTSPSIHAISGSSTQTCDPTMMFRGVPWTIINKQGKESVKWSYNQKVRRTKTKTKKWVSFWKLTMMLNSAFHENQNGCLQNGTKLNWCWWDEGSGGVSWREKMLFILKTYRDTIRIWSEKWWLREPPNGNQSSTCHGGDSLRLNGVACTVVVVWSLIQGRFFLKRDFWKRFWLIFPNMGTINFLFSFPRQKKNKKTKTLSLFISWERNFSVEQKQREIYMYIYIHNLYPIFCILYTI